MPKFLVTMNYVEAKQTSFIIEAKNEDDLHDGLGEFDGDFFEENCDWTTSDYEPPIVEDVERLSNKKTKPFTGTVKNRKIQKEFNKTIKLFEKMDKENNNA